MKTITLFDSIPIDVEDEENAFILFDIDGVICKSDVKLPKRYDKIATKMDAVYEHQRRCQLTDEFKRTVDQLLENGIGFEFLTARGEYSIPETERLFRDGGYPQFASLVNYATRNDDAITQETYTKRKIAIIRDKEKINYGKKIYYVDDNEPFVDFVNQQNGSTIAIHYTNEE